MPKRAKSGSSRGSKARRRDYRAEYRRRVQRGLSKGLSVSVARGHARAGERPKPANPVPINPKSKEEIALKIIKSGANSLRGTAQLMGLSEQYLRRYMKENVVATRVGNRWVIEDQRARRFPLYSQRMLVSPWLTPNEASSASFYSMLAVSSW
jgi:hypothetical protein